MVDFDDSLEYPIKRYDQFPSGESVGFGREQGFNTIIQINDPGLFTDEARKDPAVQAFLNAPFSVSFVQLKSSVREAEYFIHTPHLAMSGIVDGIVGRVARFPGTNPHIGTFVINHEATLARAIMRALIIEDGAQTGSMIHKQPEDSGPTGALPGV